MERNVRSVAATVLLCVGLVAGLSKPASATIWCVNPGGTNGCFATIGSAVSAAAANDTVNVAPGTYKEDVIIGKPLSLVGAGAIRTVIDATGLANGVYVDGLDHVGLSNVVVRGFTVKNANYEGILITNASGITISNNNITYNDKSLEPTPACPGQPAFETSEEFDCGEGLHLSGADHSIVANNLVANNSGGILISDDTAAVHDNLIIGNIIRDNVLDCGITMASHGPYLLAPGSDHYGVVRNTIANNQSIGNGTQGGGAGVGLFSDGSGPGLVSGNVTINNVIKNSGIPGVAIHSHAPGDTFADNVIAGNQISGNGADAGDTVTPGPTGINVNSGFGGSLISGMVIAQNTFDKEAYDLFINTPAQVDAHLNSFTGHNTVGVDNSSGNAVNATENWWGCFGGPGAGGCSTVQGPVLFNPWLVLPFGANGLF